MWIVAALPLAGLALALTLPLTGAGSADQSA